MKVQVRKEVLRINQSKGALSFLHVSDIHLWFSKKKLQSIKQELERGSYELLVLTGDYYDTTYGAKLFIKFLKEISKRVRVVFIRGNHDFFYGRALADSLLTIENCFCVEDEIYRHVHNTKFFNFTSWQNKNALLRGTDVNIVLVHKPSHIREDELEGMNLILAGHLHGGQIVLFKTKKNYFFPACLFYKYCTDKLTIGNTTLIVNRGMGDTLPVRVNCPYEMVAIQIG